MNRLSNIRHRIDRIHPSPHVLNHKLQFLLLLRQPLLLPPRLQLCPQQPQRNKPPINWPSIVRRVSEGGSTTSTPSMPANDDVPNDFLVRGRVLEVLDGVAENAALREFPGAHDVGDSAVDEDVAGCKLQEGRFGHARVGAAEPEDLGLLLFGEVGEEGWGGGVDVVGPDFVVFEASGPFVEDYGGTRSKCDDGVGSFVARDCTYIQGAGVPVAMGAC